MMVKKNQIFVFLFFSLYVIINLVKMVHTAYFTVGGFEYRIFEISDWLINYEGGFVRRGLLGELLYWFTKIHLCDVRLLVMWIVIVTSGLFLGLVISIFKREGFSLLIVPTGCFAGFTLFALFGRRDMLTFLFAYTIFILFRSLMGNERRNYCKWILFYVLSILLILIHESAFFYTFPILMFIFYLKAPKNHVPEKKVVNCLMSFSPILLTMATVCLFKGSKEIADCIWASWKPVINAFPDASEGGKIFGLDALSWKTVDTIFLHLRLSYLGANPSVLRIFMVLLNWCAVYYLLTRLDVLKTGSQQLISHTYMSNVVLIQFFFMVPMFGILSSDWGRTLPYWAISSVFIFHVFKKDILSFPHGLSSFSFKIQNYIDRKKMLLSPYTYLMVALVAPFSLYWAPDFGNLIQTELLRYANKILLLVL